MLQEFVRFLRDDRGAAVPTTLLPLAAVSGLAALAAHSLHHHLAQGVAPGGLGGNLDPGAAAGAGVAAVPVVAGATKWEWECGGKMLLMNRDLARDKLLFAPPRDNAKDERR